MSSNLFLEKLCQYCGKKFIARTTVTQFCGDKCAKLAYKKKKRDIKLKFAPMENDLSKLHGPDKVRLGNNKVITVEPMTLVKSRDFFSLSQTATLLGVSERTLYRMINREQLNTIKIGGRTLIKKSELLPYFS